jgi:glycosyltransferase involved in cell wall biosynthesis
MTTTSAKRPHAARETSDAGFRPVRVAYLVNQYPQTSQSFIRREIAALESLGCEVHRFTVRPGPADLPDALDRRERELTRAVLNRGALGLLIDLLIVMLTRPGRFVAALNDTRRLARNSTRGLAIHLAYLAEACALLRMLQRARITHVHAHFGTNSTAVAMLVHSLGGPGYSFTCHGPEEFDSPQALSLGLKADRARFVAVISSFGRSQLFRWASRQTWEKVKIVRCGLDAAVLGHPAVPVPDRPVLLNIGRLTEQKGQLLLLDAMAEVVARGHPVELRIIGDGELRSALERRIDALKLREHVSLLGWQDSTRVRDELDACRALVLPSFAEGLPVVVMEALARCRPVIASRIAGIPELVVEGESGWLITPGDAASLADAMERVLTTPPHRLQEMGRRGREAVELLHSADTEAARLAGLIATCDPASVIDRNAVQRSQA